MRIRQYPISSSPLWNATCISITLFIVQLPNEAGLSNKFLGVASNYLAKVCIDDRVQVGIRSSAATFHLPEDPSVPVVMFAAGSGIAPMRGFVQQRVEQAKSRRNVGKMVLFYGCRSSEQISFANALKESLISLVKIRHAGWDDERLARKWEFIQKERLATDVFA
ncbi:hypothetical protein M422DRAFT_243758 [Sphaerobolus stellatus SS14]|nr:hypothetical protein M422DRAFT_243758 [Sphaerobolus stellatus SS14]